MTGQGGGWSSAPPRGVRGRGAVSPTSEVAGAFRALVTGVFLGFAHGIIASIAPGFAQSLGQPLPAGNALRSIVGRPDSGTVVESP